MQMTLVAYYDEKPKVIERLILSLQGELSVRLGSAFEPYSLQQVHATIIGLEAVREGAELFNLNFRELRGQDRPMNFAEILRFLETSSQLPFDVQLGGFAPSFAYSFASRGEHPYFRSFSLQGEIAVAIGWPVSGDQYPPQLERLRKSFNAYNVLHKYHQTSNDRDNDFFFVLGRIEQNAILARQVEETHAALCEKLANTEPVIVSVGREDLSIALYEDARLPLADTIHLPLVRAKEEMEGVLRSYPLGETS